MKIDKTLTPAEVRHLTTFVLDVLHTIKYDDTGVTDDLAEGAEVAAEILGLNDKKVEFENDPEDVDE